MTYVTGWFTTGASTGNKVLTGIGLQPAYIRLTMGQKTGVAEAFTHYSEGASDGTNTWVCSGFQDTTGGKSLEATGTIITLMSRSGGTINNDIVATLVSFDANGFTLNFSAIVTGYHVHYECFS